MGETIAVIDFETTGGAMNDGGRATEVAVVLLRDGAITGKFQSLMRTGVWIPSFIEELTGISNQMVAQAPDAEKVMEQAWRFVGDAPLVAHNAAFDQKVWAAECLRIGRDSGAEAPFACSLLLARRLYPDSPNHKLATVLKHTGAQVPGRAHRAMVDTMMAAALLARMQKKMRDAWELSHAPHALMREIQRLPIKKFQSGARQKAQEMGLVAPRAPIVPVIPYGYPTAALPRPGSGER